MTWYPFNPNVNGEIQTDDTVNNTRGHVSCYTVAAATATAPSATACLASTVLPTSGTLKFIKQTIPNPATTSVVYVVCNQAHTGTVTVTGTDGDDQAASDTITLSGTTPVAGTQLFKTITAIRVPARNASGDIVKVGSLTDDDAYLTATLVATQPNEYTELITNPNVARCLQVDGNAATATGNVVVTGTNRLGESITETIVANGTTAVDGVKAFETIATITLPTRGAASDELSLGVNGALGLPDKLPVNTVLRVTVGGTVQSSTTVGASATAIDGNYVLGGTTVLDGTKEFRAYYIV